MGRRSTSNASAFGVPLGVLSRAIGLPVFQARPHLPARTNELLVSAMIRSLRGIDLHLCFRIRTHSYA
jgi:hypothetical protein